MTVAATIRAIKAIDGMTARYHSDCSEYRITMTMDAIVAKEGHTYSQAAYRAEALACYETDEESAIGTARAMSAHWFNR